MDNVIKATGVVRLIKMMIAEGQRTLAIEAVMLIYDTNVVDATNYIHYMEIKYEKQLQSGSD